MSLLSLLRRDPSGVCQFQSHRVFFSVMAGKGGEMKNGEKFKKIYDFVVCTLDLRVLVKYYLSTVALRTYYSKSVLRVHAGVIRFNKMD